MNPAYAMQWDAVWRAGAWQELTSQDWDILVIGGGITGAGILSEARQMGYRAALIEAHDFAAGTSSRSSKLVHGGLRYLKNAQIKLTLESVGERERLLRQGKGLISRLGFLYAARKGDKLPPWIFRAGLVAYDIMAGQWSHRAYDVEDMLALCPPLESPQLTGGFRYFDAQTDDARLVLRVLREAARNGGLALNYAKAVNILRGHNSQVCGAAVMDAADPAQPIHEVRAKLVINATGAWADGLRSKLGRAPRLRPLRGSHLIFSTQRLPINRAVAWNHPVDGRPVFAIPWEGVTLFGTTDVDQGQELPIDACISRDEISYLLEAVQAAFPNQALTGADIISTFAGIRPVVNTGASDPSKESREHVLWQENGMLTVSGGKLTTFRLMARDALKLAQRLLPAPRPFDVHAPVLDAIPAEAESALSGLTIKPAARLRLAGRYAADLPSFLMGTPAQAITPLPGAPYLLAELLWAAKHEAVQHLDDLMLRRTRLGLLLRNGALTELDELRQSLQPALAWSDPRWDAERTAYARLIQGCYNSQH